MSKKKDEINRVINLLARWIGEIQASNALSYFDINKVSEGTAMKLLNLIFNYKLSDLNLVKVNYPGVDLGDQENGIAIQVTSQTTAGKIKYSLDKFYENGLDEVYRGGLKMFVFSFLRKNTKKFKGYEKYESRFDLTKDVINFSDLVKEIEKIYDNDFDKFNIIHNFLNDEFGDKSAITPKPLLVFPEISQKFSFYRDVFIKVHGSDSVGFVSGYCLFDGANEEIDDFINGKLSADKVIIAGKSGLGKTMLSKRIAIHSFNRNYIPVFIEAKYFDNDLESILYSEIKILGYDSVQSFLKDCRKIEKRVLLIIDGLNECKEDKQVKLVAQLTEIYNQHNVNLLVSLQDFNSSVTDMRAIVLSINLPSQETKIAIAKNKGTVNERVESLLTMAETNFEASMIGELSLYDLKSISRFNLYDLYVRKKLHLNSDCIPFLSTVAKFLSKNISFAITQRQIEGILLSTKAEKETLQKCLKSGLLKQNLDKFSFSHEILLNFFISDSINRFSKNSDDLIYKLMLPQNNGIQILILGSLEDRTLLIKALEAITDSKLLFEIITGECGSLAQKWGKTKMEHIMSKMEMECKNVKFAFSDFDNHPIIAVPDTLLEWTSQERSFVLTIPEFFSKGLLINEFFKIIGLMDQTCTIPSNLLSEKENILTVGDYSKIFTFCFTVFFGNPQPQPVIAHLFTFFSSSFFSFYDDKRITEENVEQMLTKGNIGKGQLYFLLLVCGFRLEKLKLLLPQILGVLKNWKYIPSHLRTEVLQKLPFCYENDEQRLEIIGYLRDIHNKTNHIWTSTMIFDALSGLGALDEDEASYEETVANQLKSILPEIDDEQSCQEAYGIYYRQFDHPYSNAFYLAISKLEKKETATFYKMCLQGVNFDLFGASLLIDSEKILKKDCCLFLRKFFNQPISKSTVPQDALKSCLLAYIILGIYNCPLYQTEYSEIDEEDIVLHTCGQIFYWLNRSDLKIEYRIENCENLLKLLFEEKKEFAIDALWQIHNSLKDHSINERFQHKNIVTIYDHFKNKLMPILRNFINDSTIQKPILAFGNIDEIMKHSISLLERFGNPLDIELLHPLTTHSVFGIAAVNAIKNLSK